MAALALKLEQPERSSETTATVLQEAFPATALGPPRVSRRAGKVIVSRSSSTMDATVSGACGGGAV